MTPKEVFSYIKGNLNKGLGIISQNLVQKVRDTYMYENKPMPDITIVIHYLNSAIVKMT
jgi:hypothetical protein